MRVLQSEEKIKSYNKWPLYFFIFFTTSKNSHITWVNSQQRMGSFLYRLTNKQKKLTKNPAVILWILKKKKINFLCERLERVMLERQILEEPMLLNVFYVLLKTCLCPNQSCNDLTGICCWAQSHLRNHCKQETWSSNSCSKLSHCNRHRRRVKLFFVSQVFLSPRVRKALPSHQAPERMEGSGWEEEEHSLWKMLFPITSYFPGPDSEITQVLTKLLLS